MNKFKAKKPRLGFFVLSQFKDSHALTVFL